jgi:hypothetical protein
MNILLFLFFFLNICGKGQQEFVDDELTLAINNTSHISYKNECLFLDKTPKETEIFSDINEKKMKKNTHHIRNTA